MNIVIAGASFPCGVSELGEVARRHGLIPTYVDHPHNKCSSECMLSSTIIGDSVPDAIALQEGLFLPLLESWVSEGIRLPAGHTLRFDRRAAIISRSKKHLSAILADAGISHVPRHGAGTLDEALLAGSTCGYPVVLRADTGYSGRGIWIAESPEELRSFWYRQSEERASSDFAEMRSVMKASADDILIEPWLPGREWSIDCVVGPRGVYLIRVCEKATGVVFGRPVTYGYRLSTNSDLWSEMEANARKWCSVLFQANEVSFACFDIRRHANGDLVPLDYGVRLGSDSIPLLVRHAGQGRNPYAAALDAGLAGDMSRMLLPAAGHALIHAYARKPGVFDCLHVGGKGVVVNSREPGFVIEQHQGVPVHRRVGSVLTYFDRQEDFDGACADSSKWLELVYSD